MLAILPKWCYNTNQADGLLIEIVLSDQEVTIYGNQHGKGFGFD